MQAPIPSPVTEQTPRINKPRPSGLSVITFVMCVFNLSAYLFTLPDLGPLTFQLLFITVMIVPSFVILWFFWNGYNWARILVLLTSVLALANLALANLLSLGNSSNMQKAVILAEAALGIFLLYWLNTKLLRNYFKQ